MFSCQHGLEGTIVADSLGYRGDDRRTCPTFSTRRARRLLFSANLSDLLATARLWERQKANAIQIN